MSAHITGMETLTADAEHTAGSDVNARLSRAQATNTENQELWQLIDDANDLVANTARTRLGLTRRPTYDQHVVHIPVIDPASGRIVA